MDDWEEDFYDDEDHYGAGSSSSSSGLKTHMVIPQNVTEAEFDLESDERRSLEERTIFFGTNHKDPNKPLDAKPSYLDPVLALRTLVECMARLNCLDDVERIISDCLERELNRLVQREQARTFVRIETSSSQQLKTKGDGTLCY